ncbi:hypothetical protein JYS20_25470 (plasmid) [Escherichia coli]|nr:hypothetical protein JYS20_25470 [Escherichia coli]
MSMPSDANKSNGDNNNTVAAREYRQLKFFETHETISLNKGFGGAPVEQKDS